MSHILQIVDPSEGTLNLAADPTSAATGYFLKSYSPVFPTLNDMRNDSIYSDGSRPIFGKADNVTEQITVEVQGVSIDDLYARIRALKRAVMNARDFFMNPMLRQCTYISFKYSGMTNTAYAVLYGGAVDEPMLDADLQAGAGSEGELMSYSVSKVTVTIQREPYWRGHPPINVHTFPGTATAIIGGNISHVSWGAGSVTPVLGDVDGLPIAILTPSATAAFDRAIIAYSSQKRAGSAHNDAGVKEAESGTLYNGSTAQADATASPGSGNSKVRTAYATLATNCRRLSIKPTLYGDYRVFARMRVNGAAIVPTAMEYNVSSSTGVVLTVANSLAVGDTIVVSGVDAGYGTTNIDGTWIAATGTTGSQVKFYVANAPTGTHPQTATHGTISAGNWTASLHWGDDPAATLTANAPVALLATYTWRMYDLGVVSTPMYRGSLFIGNDAAVTSYFELWAQKINGEMDLEIDFLWFAPLEYYISGSNLGITSPNNGSLMYDGASPDRPLIGSIFTLSENLAQKQSAVITGNLKLPPGSGTIYYMTGDANWGNLLDNGDNITMALMYTPLYLTARGAT